GGDDRIAMFLRDRSNRMSTVSKEGVVEVGNDETDAAASLAAKGPRQLIRAIGQLFDCVLHAACSFFGDWHCSAENTGNGHCAHASQPGDVGHSRFSMHGLFPF